MLFLICDDREFLPDVPPYVPVLGGLTVYGDLLPDFFGWSSAALRGPAQSLAGSYADTLVLLACN